MWHLHLAIQHSVQVTDGLRHTAHSACERDDLANSARVIELLEKIQKWQQECEQAQAFSIKTT